MNRKLLAIAVGAAVAFPGVALADGPKVYGKVNVSLENVELEDSANPAADEDQWQLDSNASRLGVKGEFDLDIAGLQAIYQAEFQIHVDDGAGSGGQTITQRNIFAGLRGNFGTLKAGRFDTPTKVAQGDVDQFNDLDADIGGILVGENREANIVQYSSPALGEMVTAHVAFIPAEGADLDGDGEPEDGLADTTSMALALERGGLYAAIARDMDMDEDLVVDDLTGGPIDITRLVAAYTMDNFEVGAIYQMAEETEGDGEETGMVVSAAFRLDRVKLKAQYGLVEGDQSENEGTLTALGADYKLAKASKAYVYWANLELEDGVTGDTEEETTLGVGLEHKF